MVVSYFPDSVDVLHDIYSTSLALHAFVSATAIIQLLRHRISFYDLLIQTQLAMALTIPELLTNTTPEHQHTGRINRIVSITVSLMDFGLRLFSVPKFGLVYLVGLNRLDWIGLYRDMSWIGLINC
jgi:hypothetical protein